MTTTACDLELFGHPDSGHACKVALALELASVDWRPHYVDIWAASASRPPRFLAANPAAEVPVLMIDGRPFVQSGAILLEIATRFACLGGETAEGLRRGRELLMWEANRIGMCLPQLKEARRVRGEGFPAGVVDWLSARFRDDCRRFDQLLGEMPYLHGTQPGVGDCAVWGYAQWLEEAGVTPSPRMARWCDTMRGLPAMKTPRGFFPI